MNPTASPRFLRSATAPGIANSAVPILIVDDNAGQRIALKAVLAPLGYDVVQADSGPAALRCLIKQNFAVILLDVVMPIMDGFETAQLIRGRQESELTPIIFVTAHDKEAMASAAAYATGAADFMFAPVQPAELCSKVGVFANLYLQAEFLSAEARRVQAAADQLTLLSDAAPIGIFRTDGDDNYIYVNRRWTEMTGVAFEDAIGKPWGLILDPSEAAAMFAARAAAADAGQHAHALRQPTADSDPPFSHRSPITQPAGSPPRIVHMLARPSSDNFDGMIGWVGTLSDVSDRAPAGPAPDAASDTSPAPGDPATPALQDARALREPAAYVLEFIEEFRDNPALAVDPQRLDVVHRNARRLSELVDELVTG